MKEKILVVIGGLILLIVLLVLMNSYTQKTIDKCVEAGNDRYYCEKGLR